MNRYRFLGTDDSRNECDCCGRTNLKSTVAISDTETGEDLWFGTSCAARALKMKVAEVKRATKAADDEKRAEERRARMVAAQESQKAWEAGLIAASGGIYDYAGRPDVFSMIQALGGYAAAKAAVDSLPA